MADDTYKKTPSDEFVSTASDQWLIDCTVAIESALAETWGLQSPLLIVSLDIPKHDLSYTLESATTQMVINLPAKQDIAYTLNAPDPVVKVLDTGQALVWTLNAPTISTTIGLTVYPSTLTMTWSQKTITLSAGDYFVDTTADAWVSGSDRWAFREPGGTVDLTIQVDVQNLTWSQASPTVAFDNTVYPYGYLKNEAGFPIRDEAGNPIETEGAMDDLTVTWSVLAPSVIKTPEILLLPNELDLTWTLNAPTVFAGALVEPATLPLAWRVSGDSIIAVTVTPDALVADWSLKQPRVLGPWRRARRRGLLTGVY